MSLEYHDRRGQYTWDVYDYADITEKHARYYALGKEEEEVYKVEGSDFKITITAMGSKTASGGLQTRKSMEDYMEEHVGHNLVLAPCGCLVE